MERICRLPSGMVLERMQKPSAMRQHSVHRSPLRTTARSAGYCLTEIGSALISRTPSFEKPDETRRRLISAAEMASLATAVFPFRERRSRPPPASVWENQKKPREVPTYINDDGNCA